MPLPNILRRLLPALLLLGTLPAQRIALLEGPGPHLLDLRLLDENSPQAPGQVILAGIEILPIEITGRTAMQADDATVARRVERHGLWRVELPGGGRLFQYRRQNGAYWGFLLVPPDGQARVLLEVAGIGAGTDAPFHDRLAVAADGQNGVVGAVLGGLHVLRLDGTTFASTGTPARFVPTAVPVDEEGCLAGPQFAFYLTQDDRLWRLPLGDLATPVEVTPPPVPGGFFKTTFAMAGDGASIVCLYGPRDQQRLWLVRSSGPAVLLPPPPSKYEDPDYLPEGSGHPHLLLNGDGSRLFYVDGLVRDELFLLDVAAAAPPLQITADPIFQPYIGVHILPKFVGATLDVAIGDAGRMDWFRAESTGVVTNLTGTGSVLQPFPAGTLDPVAAVAAGGTLLSTEVASLGGALRLRRIDLQSGSHAVAYGDLTAVPLPGSAFTGAADLIVRGTGGDRLLLGGSGVELAATPPGLRLAPPSRGPQYSATWLHLASGWGLTVFYLPNGSVLTGPFEHGVTQLTMTAAGGCVVLGTLPRYLAPGVLAPLNLAPAALRVCVSGAGG